MKNSKLLLVFVSFFAVGSLFAQEPVLLGSYVDVSRVDAAETSGQEVIFLEPTTGYLVTGVILNRDSVIAYVSTDGGVLWTTSNYINGGPEDEIKNISVFGDADTPYFVFAKRGSTPGEAPWARHLTYIASDDAGWSGDAFSITPVATAGTETNVLDAYYPSIDISSFDPNLRGIVALHGSSQSGGEYYQYFYSPDGGANWSDRIKVVSSAAVDTLEGYYVADLTSNSSPDFQHGPNGTVLMAGIAKIEDVDDGSDYRLWYTMSSDSGQTWSDVNLILGADSIYIDRGIADRAWKVFVDANNDFHVFALAKDNSEVWAAYDFKLTGSSWTVSRFAESQLLDNGLVAIEDDWGDYAPLNAPTLNTDGTIFYSFIDVVDTTGGVNDYCLYTVYSMDNGGTWSDRVQLIDDPEFNAEEVTDIARNANDKLHVVYCKVDTSGGSETISQYYLQIPTSTITSIDDNRDVNIVKNYSLLQNYPNPFNPTTTIRFYLNKKSIVSVSVYNILGEKVATLIADKTFSHGKKEIIWNADNFPSGIYYYQLKTGDGFKATKKMVLMK